MASVFISHSSVDKAFAVRLAEDLDRLGHRPWLDEWEIRVGECIVSKVNKGIEDSDYVVIVLSVSSVMSGWVEKEWKAKYWSEIDAQKPLVLPVVIESCEIPALLRTKKYADFLSSYSVGFVELTKALGTESLRERKTLQPTEFAATPSENTQKTATTMPSWYWHPAVHEFCGNTLHFVLVRYRNESILFKSSVLSDLERAQAWNYMIFELFSEWDILVRLWATDDMANTFVKYLEENNDIQDVDHLRVKRHIHLPDDERQFRREDVLRAIEDLGLSALLDIQSRGENSTRFSAAVEKGLLLRDTVAFDPGRIQFYIVLRSMRRPDESSVQQLIEHIRQSTRIRGRSLYITSGTSIRMIVKGQAADFYDISDFLEGITQTSRQAKNRITTETMPVANRNVKVRNDIDFNRAQTQILEKSFSAFLSTIPEKPAISFQDKMAVMAKYCVVLPLFSQDDQDVLRNLLRARVSGSPHYIGQIKDFFPHFEQTLRDNLPALIRKHYGQDWQDQLDKIKKRQGIPEPTTVAKMSLGDLLRVYRQLQEDHEVLDLKDVTATEFSRVMDDIPKFRNILAHSAASLQGWDELFDFCSRFVPIRRALMNYLDDFQGPHT